MKNPKQRIDEPVSEDEKFHIFGKKNGRKEFFKTEIGRKTAEEEAERLEDSRDDGTKFFVEAKI